MSKLKSADIDFLTTISPLMLYIICYLESENQFEGNWIKEDDLIEKIIKYVRLKCKERLNLKLNEDEMSDAFFRMGRLCFKKNASLFYSDQELKSEIEDEDKRNLILKCGLFNQQPFSKLEQTTVFYEAAHKCFLDFIHDSSVCRDYSSKKDLKDFEKVINWLKETRICEIRIIKNFIISFHYYPYSIVLTKNDTLAVFITKQLNFENYFIGLNYKRKDYKWRDVEQESQISRLKKSCSFVSHQCFQIFDLLFPTKNENSFKISKIYFFRLKNENKLDINPLSTSDYPILIQSIFQSVECKDPSFDQLSVLEETNPKNFISVSLTPSVLKNSQTKLRHYFSQHGVDLPLTESPTKPTLLHRVFDTCRRNGDLIWVICISLVFEEDDQIHIYIDENDVAHDETFHVILKDIVDDVPHIKFLFGRDCFSDQRADGAGCSSDQQLIDNKFSQLTKMVWEFCGERISQGIGQGIGAFFIHQENQPTGLFLQRKSQNCIRTPFLGMHFSLNGKIILLEWENHLIDFSQFLTFFGVKHFSEVPVVIQENFSIEIYQLTKEDLKTTFNLLNDFCLLYQTTPPMPSWEEKWTIGDVIEHFRNAFKSNHPHFQILTNNKIYWMHNDDAVNYDVFKDPTFPLLITVSTYLD